MQVVKMGKTWLFKMMRWIANTEYRYLFEEILPAEKIENNEKSP